MAATDEHEITMTLKSQTSVKGVKVTAKGRYWKDADREEFPEDVDVPGTVDRWVSTNDSKLRIEWPDGWDTEYLSYLLAPGVEFKLVSDRNGGAVRRRGAAHVPVHAPGAAALAAETVTVPYKIGVLDYEQVWTLCHEPISEDWRVEPRYEPTMKIDKGTMPDIYSVYMNSAQCFNILLKQLKCMNARLSGIVSSRDTINKFTTIGELIRMKAVILTSALHPEMTRDELYRESTRTSSTCSPRPSSASSAWGRTGSTSCSR